MRSLIIGMSLVALMGCAPNKAKVIIHPDIVHLRVVLQHGSAPDEFRKLVEKTRLDFENNKAALSESDRKTCESAISAAEFYIDFATTYISLDADTLAHDYKQIHEATGAYKSEREYLKDESSFKDVSITDSSQSVEQYQLQSRINNLTLSIIFAKMRQAVTEKMKLAEAATDIK